MSKDYIFTMSHEWSLKIGFVALIVKFFTLGMYTKQENGQLVNKSPCMHRHYNVGPGAFSKALDSTTILYNKIILYIHMIHTSEKQVLLYTTFVIL